MITVIFRRHQPSGPYEVFRCKLPAVPRAKEGVFIPAGFLGTVLHVDWEVSEGEATATVTLN